jgi:hypothetical protein
MKAQMIELIDMMDIVKIWIQLNIPKIEDGGNSGVEVQAPIKITMPLS